MNRRRFLSFAGASLGSALASSAWTRAFEVEGGGAKIKAIALDAFPIFNPAPVFMLAEKLFPGKGRELSEQWRTRQFEYCWLRTVTHHYADFWQVTEDALVFAAHRLKLELKADQRDELMNSYLKLAIWPDAGAAVNRLKAHGLKLAFLSNFTQRMLQANIENAGLGKVFDHVISTERARTYKPDPRAYQLGVDVLGFKREEILFAGFAGWDAAGAKLFGYPTFWVNRLKLPAEELGGIPDGSGDSMFELVEFLESRTASA